MKRRVADKHTRPAWRRDNIETDRDSGGRQAVD